MQNLQDYILISGLRAQDKKMVTIDEELVSNYLPVFHKGHFCFFHGIIHNAAELKSLPGTDQGSIEAVLIDHYLADKEKFPVLLSGNFSLVIGNKEELYLLRDPNGYENLYYSVRASGDGGILISNSIKEIAAYIRLQVNTDILPGYFLKTDINSGETFFKDFFTPAFFQYVKITRSPLAVEKESYETFFTESETVRNISEKKLINEFDDLIGETIQLKYNQFHKNFPVINSLSGGTDSSFIQYYLIKNNSDIAYTANFLKTGLDHSYASDVAALLNLKHKTVHSDINHIIRDLPSGIHTSEKPYLFTGESLLLHMYEKIREDYGVPVACFDGAGAEGILGASKILYELRIIRKYRFIFRFLLPFIRILSEKHFSRYNEFYTCVNSKKIPENFILRYFTDKKLWDAVKKAFKLNDLNHIDDYEISMMKKYNTSLFEAVYRYLAFELEFRRVSNIRAQLAKRNGIFLVFPFTETRISKYLTPVDTEIKLRKARTKYIFRKAMEKKFPKEIVYRKKIMKNVSFFDEFLQNQKIKELINEIKDKQYPYFSFNYDEVFGSPAYSAIAYKMINFHIWHKLFIDGADCGEFEKKLLS